MDMVRGGYKGKVWGDTLIQKIRTKLLNYCLFFLFDNFLLVIKKGHFET